VRLGTRNGLVFGIAVEAAALGLMGFAHGVAVFSVLAFFVGFGSGLSFPGVKNILSTFPEADRAKAFSTLQMCCQVGAISGALIGGLFLGADMAIVFLVVFLLFMGYCVAVLLFIPADMNAQVSLGSLERTPPLVDLAVLKGIRFGGGGRYFLLSTLFWFLFSSFLVGVPLHMQSFVPQWPTSMPFWVTGIALLVLQYPVFRFMIKRLAPAQVMATGFAAMGLAYLLFGAGRTSMWVVLGCLTVVLGEILFTPAFDLWVAKRIPVDRLAKAMGAMHFFRSAGNMAGTLSGGLLYDLSRTSGVPGLNWYVVAAVAGMCALTGFAGLKKETVPVRGAEEQSPLAVVGSSPRLTSARTAEAEGAS
jgi:MFS family permease